MCTQKTRRQVEREGPGGMGKLFNYMGPDVFKRPTYLMFCSLLDNYQRESNALAGFAIIDRCDNYLPWACAWVVLLERALPWRAVL